MGCSGLFHVTEYTHPELCRRTSNAIRRFKLTRKRTVPSSTSHSPDISYPAGLFSYSTSSTFCHGYKDCFAKATCDSCYSMSDMYQKRCSAHSRVIDPLGNYTEVMSQGGRTHSCCYSIDFIFVYSAVFDCIYCSIYV